MRQDKVEEIQIEFGRTERDFDALFATLGSFSDREGSSFDVSRDIPGTDLSLSEIRARNAAMAGLIRKLDPKGATLVPLADFTSASKSIRAVRNAIGQIVSRIEELNANFGGIDRFDFETFFAYTTGGAEIDLQGHFKTVFDSSESLLAAFQQIFQAVTPSKAAFNFSSAAVALSSIISSASKTRGQLEKYAQSIETRLKELESNVQQTNELLESSRAADRAISEQLGKVNEAVGQISAINDNAVALGQQAADLRNQINQYSEQFNSFQDALDAREDAIRKGSDDLQKLRVSLSEHQNSIAKVIEKSNQMLSGATVAGLASEFGTIREKLSSEVDAAHLSFKRSIVVLTACAVPLILFIFAPFIAPYISNDDRLINAIAGTSSTQGGWHYVGQVLARLVILLPAIWYVTFCSGRYNSLFKLREHYSYKYSMAVAVEGFKKQSPGYEDMVAALVFEQLAFNPADKLGKQKVGPQAPPNPIANLLFSTLRKKFDNGIDE